MLSLLGREGQPAGQSTACCIFALFQLAAIGSMLALLLLCSLWAWGLVVLAVAGINQLSCGPVFKSIQESQERAVQKLEMSASRMRVREVRPGEQRMTRGPDAGTSASTGATGGGPAGLAAVIVVGAGGAAVPGSREAQAEAQEQGEAEDQPLLAASAAAHLQQEDCSGIGGGGRAAAALL